VGRLTVPIGNCQDREHPLVDRIGPVACDIGAIPLGQYLTRYIDEATRIDDEVGSVEDVSLAKRFGMVVAEELVVRTADNRFAAERIDCLIIENAPKGARGENIALL
jgi:hypothetical protein